MAPGHYLEALQVDIMKIVIRLIYIVLGLAPAFFKGQVDLTIHKKTKLLQTKKLKLDRVYSIKTLDTVYSSRIVGFTDSTIKITKSVKTTDSVMYITKYPNPNATDTTYYRKWRDDTINIAFRHIISLEKDIFKSRHWLEPFGFLAVGGALGVVLIPISAVAYGPDDAVKVAVPFLSILAVTLPIIYIGTRKTKYDMQNEWTFK